jgi:pteridine reductase
VGAAISRALVANGFSVIVHCHRSREAAEALQSELGNEAIQIVQADLSDPAAIEPLRARVSQLCAAGGLSALVHNASNFDRIEPQDLDVAAWDRAMTLNARAPFALTLALRAELSTARAAVVAITCTSAEKPWKNYAAYSISKAALAHAMSALALVLAPEIRTGCVAPGTVLPPESYTDEQLTRMKRSVPLQRFGDPQQIANGVLFFVQNDFVTGSTITVDGGRRLQ